MTEAAWALLAWTGALAAAGPIGWSVWRTGVAPMPSNAACHSAVAVALEDAPPGPILELGAGWGGLALAIARARPDRRVIAVEMAAPPRLVAGLRARRAGLANIALGGGDGLDRVGPELGAVVCYLGPAQMRRLAERLERADMAGWPGLVVSLGFALPGRAEPPSRRLPGLFSLPLYRYRPGRVSPVPPASGASGPD